MCQPDSAERQIAHLKLHINNLEQLVEAYGDDNRYYAGLSLGHAPTQKEALEYYLGHGGATGHRARMNNNPPPG